MVFPVDISVVAVPDKFIKVSMAETGSLVLCNIRDTIPKRVLTAHKGHPGEIHQACVRIDV